jgi:4-amino-4-deoxy-L-arabinose transferase-like glycosyltransferase
MTLTDGGVWYQRTGVGEWRLCYTHPGMSMTQSQRRLPSGQRLWSAGLFALALFTLVRSLIWASVNPPFNIGDETAHLHYVMQLRNNGALPVFKYGPDCEPDPVSTPPDPAALSYIAERGYGGWPGWTTRPYESYQPPLYYLTAALVALPLAKDDARGTLYAGRMLSALLATLTVVVAAFAMRELTGRPGTALAATAVIASVPTFGFFGGSLNNDNLLNLISAAFLLVAIRTLRTPGTMLLRGALLMGVLAGGGVLTKATAAILLPVGVLTVALAGWLLVPGGLFAALRRPEYWRAVAVPGVALVAGWLVVAGWYMVRSMQVYGDLFGTANQVQYGWICMGPTIMSGGWAGLPRYLMSLALLTPGSFLAKFGWGDEGVSATVYYAAIIPVLALVSYMAVRWLVKSWAGITAYRRAAIVVMAALTALNLAVWIGFNVVHQFQPVGRYLYVSLIPIAGFLAVGVLHFRAPGWFRTALLVVVIVGMAVLTVHGYMFAGSGTINQEAVQLARG